MSTQTTISQYFSNQKRLTNDEIKSVNQGSKVLTSDINKIHPIKESGDARLVLKRKINWDDDELPRKKITTPSHHNPKRTPQFSTLRASIKKARVKSAERSGIRRNLFSSVKSKASSSSEEAVGSPTDPKPLDGSPVPSPSADVPCVDIKAEVIQEVKSTGIEQVKVENDQIVPSTSAEKIQVLNIPKEETNSFLNPTDNSIGNVHPTDIQPQPSTSKQSSLRKELGLGDLKSKLKGSSRLAQIKEAIKNIDKGYNKLNEIRSKLDNAPRLKEFDTIEIEVPASPVKSFKWEAPSPLKFTSPSKLREAVFKSPAKAPLPNSGLPYVSPRKLLEEMRPRDSSSSIKTDYYSRCSVLAAQEGKPCLPLPHSYRILAELFKSLEVVLSMLHSRNESAYFSKVRTSTQELCKKTFAEHHLGQMLRIFPNAFRLSYCKVKVHGKPDHYELTIHPVVLSNDGSSGGRNPTSLLERQRYFYKQLLDLVKSHHEKYLLSLDPPLVVDKSKLTRWHPGFDVDSCPDIQPVDMPQPPQTETFTSAKQLFGKAKELFMVNPRMEKALDKLPKSGCNTLSNGKPSAASAIPGLANALKGIPKSLLEKVRAKQAAKAVEMLTRDPQIAKQEIELSRLPEMARILRYLFVVEKKNVMAKSRILDKLSSSFRENLSSCEMDRHLMLLVKKTRNWLKVHKDHNVTYLTMDKSMEMNIVYNSINQS